MKPPEAYKDKMFISTALSAKWLAENTALNAVFFLQDSLQV